MRINAKGIHYRQLNELIREAAERGEKNIVLDNVNGQRYIGCGLSQHAKIIVNGVAGNDLAVFMNGPEIIVNSNGQDCIGNTMNAGSIIVYGDAGDIAGHSMRGGKIYIKGNAGYRIGIHMKSYESSYPVIIIGGVAGDFLGEYMAGGMLVVLGLCKDSGKKIVGNFCGTGMHGGTMYIRGDVKDYQLGVEARKTGLDKEDRKVLREYLKEYCGYFSLPLEKILNSRFVKLEPSSSRPYKKLYAY